MDDSQKKKLLKLREQLLKEKEKSLKQLEDAFAGLGIQPFGTAQPGVKPDDIMRRRRAFSRREERPLTQLSLVRGPDGVLRWLDGAPGLAASGSGGMGRRAGRAAVPAGTIERQFVFEKLHEPSQVYSALEDLDAKLTNPKKRELWQWTPGGW